MKKNLLILTLLSGITSVLFAQVTTPAKRANFGVDADLRANFFDNAIETGNDDWFRNNGTVGEFIIDTTGAAYLLSRYASDPSSRRLPFFRNMRFPQFSVVNGKLLIDAMFIRDYHGDDSTVFFGGNKNGMNPDNWTCPVSQGVPDKNDILDMFIHVRRDGTSGSDSLWLFGAFSLDNTTGNRYIDFEMYQTDIYYDRTALRFYGYGPDAGHTAWQFDAAGNVTRAGDIIFTAEYGSSSLSMVEARIWINKSALSLTPTVFNWGGLFDGASAGSTYGYASIAPKTAGTYYTGLQCGNNTWAGPFQAVLQNNIIVTDYNARQFMEFSVNLSKLGLDPYINSSDPCLMPFRRIMVKTRASTSFTAELKDFVGPFDFFRAARASAAADIPMYCGVTGISNITVTNALSTSLYTWSTTNGNIIGSTIGPAITVDQPGDYVVSQELMDSCGTTYARDTVTVTLDPNCSVLKTMLKDFTATRSSKFLQLSWKVLNQTSTKYYEIERSTGNSPFSVIGKVLTNGSNSPITSYTYSDIISDLQTETLYYRLKFTDMNGNVQYSQIIAENLSSDRTAIRLLRNGVSGSQTHLSLSAAKDSDAKIEIYNQAGAIVVSSRIKVPKGVSVIPLNSLESKSSGVYIIKVVVDNVIYSDKIIQIK
ncbi:MAG TPA: T9SS type A sorting domain-containing protein [Flavitalea sp.]|nr:T9SS type A sorting domain-containing protein [Flavitalea sp.]